MNPWALLAIFASTIPVLIFTVNYSVFRRLPKARPMQGRRLPKVSVLIPARNEENEIAPALTSVLANQGVEFEVVVLDDESEDATAAIVARMAACDPRVRLVSAPPLPAGWTGKTHACHVLGHLARHPYLVFMDADVRLTPDALERILGALEQSPASLISGFPRQICGTLFEKLVIPMIHFILLGFLPLHGLRHTRMAAFSAGCGQLIAVQAAAYFAAGGHAGIRRSLHDGITLPRSLRRAGFRTDIFDASDLAICRMYTTWAGVWQGFSKNATEGMGNPAALLPFTGMLFAGQVLPWILILTGIGQAGVVWGAALSGLLVRILAAARYRQPWSTIALHPVATLTLLANQWFGLIHAILGKSASWRGRFYPALHTFKHPNKPFQKS